MFCEVCKPFQAVDRMLTVGERVDASSWRARNVANLIERRYLRPLGETAAPLASPPTGKKKEEKHG